MTGATRAMKRIDDDDERRRATKSEERRAKSDARADDESSVQKPIDERVESLCERTNYNTTARLRVLPAEVRPRRLPHAHRPAPLCALCSSPTAPPSSGFPTSSVAPSSRSGVDDDVLRGLDRVDLATRRIRRRRRRRRARMGNHPSSASPAAPGCESSNGAVDPSPSTPSPSPALSARANFPAVPLVSLSSSSSYLPRPPLPPPTPSSPSLSSTFSPVVVHRRAHAFEQILHVPRLFSSPPSTPPSPPPPPRDRTSSSSRTSRGPPPPTACSAAASSSRAASASGATARCPTPRGGRRPRDPRRLRGERTNASVNRASHRSNETIR